MTSTDSSAKVETRLSMLIEDLCPATKATLTTLELDCFACKYERRFAAMTEMLLVSLTISLRVSGLTASIGHMGVEFLTAQAC